VLFLNHTHNYFLDVQQREMTIYLCTCYLLRASKIAKSHFFRLEYIVPLERTSSFIYFRRDKRNATLMTAAVRILSKFYQNIKSTIISFIPVLMRLRREIALCEAKDLSISQLKFVSSHTSYETSDESSLPVRNDDTRDKKKSFW
jgi:hypothetical protein